MKAIFADKAGRIWVGTHSGLYLADSSAGGMSNGFKLFKGTGNKNVRVLAEDKRGSIWAGCNDGTLLRLTGDGLAEFHPSENKTTNPIWSLLPDDDGTIWVGTFRGGLLRFRNNKFTRFDIDEGLPNNIISQILPGTSTFP